MKQFAAFASKFRINALLCCSAVVLLTACGGNIETGSNELAATAADVTTDAGAAAAASTAAPAPAVEASVEAAPVVEAIAEAAPAVAANAAAAPAASIETASAASTEAAPTANTAGTTGQAADVTTQAFALTGYDSTPLPAQAGQQDAGANLTASIKQ